MLGNASSRVAQTPLIQVLAEDSDLAESVPEPRRAAAVASCRVPLWTARAGPWTAPTSASSGCLGLLVLEGIVLRAFELGQRRGVVLLGPGDVIKPWTSAAVWRDTAIAEWRFLTPVRMALLDRGFTTQLGTYPELAVELIDRVLQRNRELVLNMAIASHTRVDTRLHLMLWQMASSWGKIRPDGVLLPIKLTHAVLSELVASRRPTITTALAELSQRGLVQRVEQGWLLLGDPPGQAAAAALDG